MISVKAIKAWLIFLAVSSIGFSSLLAQPVADGATNTLSEVTNAFTRDVIVGTNGSFTLLVLSDNALLTNSPNGLISRNGTASSNEVRLISPTARWQMNNTLFVGSNGAFSRLMVSNGARVENFDGVLANGAASSNNSALVVGGGSLWTNRGDLTVGFSGWNNQLLISNGGWVADRFGYVGRQPGSSNNLARITGVGSGWSNLFDVFLGANDRSNRLVIESGGIVVCANGVISGSSSAGNCEAIVTGSGSLWSNRFFLFIGDVAGRNQLVVSNGARVWSGGSILGNLSPAVSNQVLVTGPGSLWTNESTLSVGGSSVGNRADAADGGWLACVDGFVGETASSHSNTVMLSGSGSGWNNLGRLIVGNSGSANVLIASNGATVLSSNATIGANVAFASNTLALLTGAGTLWSNRNDFLVGSNGSNNRLVVSNAAQVIAGTNVIVGFNASGSNNTVLLTGPGSTLSSINNVMVGQIGSGNRFMVSNGASANSQSLYLGLNSASSNNEAIITGPGSIWTAPEWGVGSSGRGNRLLVNNGGQVLGTSATVGAFGLGDNLATLTDSGSSWTNIGEFYVGLGDSRNALVVSNGSVLFTESMMIGRDSSSLSNRLTVAGGTLFVANDADTGTLEVRRGINVLNSGLIDVDFLRLTNTQGLFDFNGGTLSAKNSRIGNGTQFRIGNGVNPATYLLASNGTHNFTGILVANVASNATFTGNGIIVGPMLFSAGSTLAPGSSIGRMIFSNAPSLQGTTIMEISKDLATLTNDLIQVTAPLTYGGSLVVQNLGPATLSEGDNFRLFSAPSFLGSFASLTLPALQSGLTWLSRLQIDGSIEVITIPPADRYWTNPQGGDYDLPANWLANALPGPQDTVHFISNATYQVHWPGNLPAANVFFDADGGTLTQTFGTWWGVTNTYIVGRASNAIAAVSHTTGALRVTNSAGTARLVIGESGNGTYNLSGGDVVTDLLVQTDTTPGRTNAFNFNHGSLTTVRGATILQDDHLRIGNTPGETASWTMLAQTNTIGLGAASETRVGTLGRAIVTVTGNTTVMTNSSTLAIGHASSFNQLVVSNSARALSVTNTIGVTAAANTNGVFVIGTNSVLASSRDTIIGLAGSSSQLLVTQGGRVESADAVIGLDIAGSNNLATVTGAGSIFTNSSSFRVGHAGSFNQLTITNGARALSATNMIGVATTARTNAVLVIGTNSLWASSRDTIIGLAGSSSQLLVTQGGRVESADAVIGLDIAGSNNLATVTGAGSIFTNSSSFRVGHAGSFNQLTITNGARALSATNMIGVATTARTNAVLVIGTNSLWASSRDTIIGLAGSSSQLLVTQGGRVESADAVIGLDIAGSNNLVTVTGAGSIFTNSSSFRVGHAGSFNQLTITNGARALSATNMIGVATTARTNAVLVIGTNSLWASSRDTIIGLAGSSSQLLVTQGGRVESADAVIGLDIAGSNNLVTVTGAGSIFTNSSSLHVGRAGSGNSLVIGTNGLVQTPLLFISRMNTATNNVLTVINGSLVATNVARTGLLQLGPAGGATLNLLSGTIEADSIVSSNGLSKTINFSGGTLRSRNTAISNGVAQVVGNGVSAATFELVGDGTHSFYNGLLLRTNAILKGDGRLSGTLTTTIGATFQPGTLSSRLILSNSPSLQGTLLIQFSKDDLVRTNSHLQVIAPLTFGGKLIGTNAGPGALTAGDRFVLFSAASFGGSFPDLSLPNLGPGLNWTNKLLLDGSLEVVTWSGPRISSTAISGTNLIMSVADGFLGGAYELLSSTNITLPLTNWNLVGAGHFDWLGSATVTNGILPGEPERYFRIRTP